MSYPLTTILCMARITTFRFALDLTPGQERDCYRFAGAARKAYNWGLGEVCRTMKLHHDQVQESGRSDTSVPFTRNALIPAFNAFKLSPEGEKDGIAFWYKQVSKFCFEEGLVDLSGGLASWRKGRAGFPRFKRKGRAKASFRLRPSTPTDIRFGTEENSRKVRLPRLGWLKVNGDTRALRRLLRPGGNGSPRSKILQATISRGARRWYLCLAVEAPDLHPARRLDPDGETFVGIDLGLYSFAVVAGEEGNLIESLSAPAPLKTELRKLRRLSKACSRTQRGSSGKRKSNRRLARHHERIANIRANFAHQLSCRLANTHGLMAVESLNVAGMVRNRRLARSISDAGWAGFVSMLCYKTDWRGGYLVRTPRFLSSSKTCSGCGAEKQELSLSERVFSCEGCGAKIDRDLNAAVNLARYGRAEYELQVAAGRAETLNVGGAESAGSAGNGSAKLSSMKPEPAKAGQPRRLPRGSNCSS